MVDLAEDSMAIHRAPALARVALVEGGIAQVPRSWGPARTSRPPLRPKILLLASLYKLPYRVLRCAAAAGAEIYVLGDLGARGLGLSRHCRKFIPSNHIISGARDEGLALEINCLVRDLDITMVIPADAPSIRSLIACRDLIDASCFPLPGLEAFDLLNNKWDFTQLAGTLGIRCPASRRFADAASFGDAIALGKIAFPVVVKPLDMSGNQGCLVMDGTATPDRLREINYQPLIVQEFVDGEDIGASVFARSGDIAAFIAHRFAGNVYSTFRDSGIEADLARLARHLDLDGVYNFDMRLGSDGKVYYLECNPRFFFNMNLSMVAGINFVLPGLTGFGGAAIASTIPDGTRVHL